MKMTAQNLFPPIKPRPEFREQLKIEVLDSYNQRRQPRFRMQWLVAPGVAVVSLLLVVFMSNGQPFSQLPGTVLPSTAPSSQLEVINSELVTQNSDQSQQNGESQSSQLAESSQNLNQVEIPQSLDQLDQELSELSDTLDTDADLEAAITFIRL